MYIFIRFTPCSLPSLSVDSLQHIPFYLLKFSLFTVTHQVHLMLPAAMLTDLPSLIVCWEPWPQGVRSATTTSHPEDTTHSTRPQALHVLSSRPLILHSCLSALGGVSLLVPHTFSLVCAPWKGCRWTTLCGVT